MKDAVQHLHFVGIGGAGMSAIAEVMHDQGCTVSGSDSVDSDVTRRLAGLGIKVSIGHAAAHIAGAQWVVTSSAVQGDNPEVMAAHAQRVPVISRAVLLGELMRGKKGIAVAGTHGKTTTTSLVASVLAEAGLDPTFVIGGTPLPGPSLHDGPPTWPVHGHRAVRAGANSHLGAGEHIVVEADESDASFLHLSPVLSVVTNIDADHMETYGHDLGRLHAAFVDFLHRLPFYGQAIVCSDDIGVQAILPQLARPVHTYGLAEGADVRAVQVQALPGGRMQFIAQRSPGSGPRRPQGPAWPDLALILNLAGEHNVRNALAAVAVAMALRLPDEAVARALARFAGVGRRFEQHGDLPSSDGGHFSLIDDYGHHPAEIAAVLQALRGAFPGRRRVVVFQPHRYSRTRDCFDAFVRVLSEFDAALLTEVYAAGETAIEGADGLALWQSLATTAARKSPAAAPPQWVPDVDALAAEVARCARHDDVVVTLGAGSIAAVPQQLKQRLAVPGGHP